MKNIELKARYPQLTKAENIARSLGAEFQWRQRQIDTYFNVNNGRFKLRECEGRDAELIAYERSNRPEARDSEYFIFRTENGSLLKQMLSSALGIKVVVAKDRTLYLLENIRIHLDEVDQLGTFIEFEAVISENSQIESSQKLLDQLYLDFELKDNLLVPLSYSDLLLVE